MSDVQKGLVWAAIILGVAAIARWNGVNEDASYALVAGLSAAAWASIGSKGTRCRVSRCL